MACPVAWRNRYMEVPGYGILRCDDTGRYDHWNGLPHIDIRVSSYAQAARYGVRRITIYSASAPARGQSAAAPAAPGDAASSASAPTATTTQEGALALARTVAPKGDANTAMVRLLRADTARQHFPALLNDLNLAPTTPLWVVTIWTPPTTIPAGAVAEPDADAGIAARYLVFRPESSEPLVDKYVSMDVLERMGWLASDSIELE
jgi:hypothetical protein